MYNKRGMYLMKEFIKNKILSPWSPETDIAFMAICLSISITCLIKYIFTKIDYKEDLSNDDINKEQQKMYDLSFKYLPKIIKTCLGLSCGFLLHYILVIFW